MAEAHGLRLYRLKLYGSEAGGGGRGVNEIIYFSMSRKKRFIGGGVLGKISQNKS